MTMVTDVYDDKDNTASCEAAVRREAEAGPSIRNNQTMRKLAMTTPGTVMMPPSMTTSTTSTMATADDATFDNDNNVDDGDG